MPLRQVRGGIGRYLLSKIRSNDLRYGLVRCCPGRRQDVTHQAVYQSGAR